MFKHFKKAAACAIAMGATSNPVLADTWKVDGSGMQTQAYVFSEDESTYVAVGCNRLGIKFEMSFLDEFLSGWTPNVDVTIVVDDKVYPVTALDGASDFVRLHTRAGGQDGVSSELLSALTSGSTLSIGGPATAEMTTASRSYSLKGSSRAIAAVRNVCN